MIRIAQVVFYMLSIPAVVVPISYARAESECVELAKIIGTNFQRYLSIDQQRAIAKADLCSSDYNSSTSAKKVQLEASYKLFSGSASASGDEVVVAQKNHCESKFGDYWRSQVTSSEALAVSAEGASIINNCLAMSESALKPKLTLSEDGTKLTFSVQYIPSSVATIKIKQFGPAFLDGLTCSVTKEDKTIIMTKTTDAVQELVPSDSILLSCNRETSSMEIDGVSYTCSKETILSVATSGPVQSLKVPRVCSTKISDSKAKVLDDKINLTRTQLEAQLAGISAQLPGKAGASDLAALSATLQNKIDGKANATNFQLRTDLGTCVGVWEHNIGGGFWPLVMVPCANGGLHQMWRTTP